MEHNLDDSLHIEGAIGVDFEHVEDTVINQADISMGGNTGDGIQMEYEHSEEQPVLMDTGNEEIIEYMDEQFIIRDYPQDDQMATLTAVTTQSQVMQQDMTLPSGSLVSLQFDPQTITMPISSEVLTTSDVQMQPKVITVQAAAQNVRPIAVKKDTVVVQSTMPRQVAIAPKPPKVDLSKMQTIQTVQGKQYAIAPRPVSLIANKSISLVKKGTPGVQPGKNTVLAQIGKQLVMVPAGAMGAMGAQKIKLVSSAAATVGSGGMTAIRVIGTADTEQGQFLKTQAVQGGKSVLAKVVLQGQSEASQVSGIQSAPRTVGSAAAAAGGTTRLVTMHQKTVPISLPDKVLMASPSKQGLKFTKKQVIRIKPTSPVTSQAGVTTKKVMITSNPTQNLILKTTAPSTGQVTKTAQKTQLHQINVPGKGIQYIRLVTNQNSGTPALKPATAPTPKTFVVSDSKGNLIQLSADKVGSQPPPLVVTSGTLQKISSSKPQQKLVRIAPVSTKPAQPTVSRGQSLLAPLSPVAPATPVAPAPPATPSPPTASELPSLDDDNDTPDENRLQDEYLQVEETDSKAALRALIADTVGEIPVEHSDHEDSRTHDTHDAHDTHDSHDSYDARDDLQRGMQDDHLDYGSSQTITVEDNGGGDRRLIVIPSYVGQEHSLSAGEDQHSYLTEDRRSNMKSIVNVEVEPYPYRSPESPSDPEYLTSDLGLRVRKPCNCTKSQCLKLYCDCFANGEFCNRCNCNNCHNNLENEELRQKAIRGCLDRNPNAFRPKIGKSKIGGPEIIRRHNKGCNCKRSGCLKNYCECYEAKIACSAICKCVGCRNVEDTLERGRRPPHARRTTAPHPHHPHHPHQPHLADGPLAPGKQPCSFMTSEVIEAVCQCLLAAAVDGPPTAPVQPIPKDPVRDVIEEFARCLQDIISASHQAQPLELLDESNA